MPTGACERLLNETVLALYRGCRNRPATEFKEWAMGLAQAAVPFDSGIWVSAQTTSRDLQSCYLFRQPPEMIENYLRVVGIAGDLLAQAVAAQPGRTIDTNSLLPRPQFVQSPPYQLHCQPYGIEQSICTCYMSPVSRVGNFISFYRADPAAPFSEEERRTKELLVPHMIEASRINLFTSLHRWKPELGVDGAAAICDALGLLYEGEQAFIDLLLSAHPDWTGPKLPLPVARLDDLAGSGWADNGLEFQVTPIKDLFVVTIRRANGLGRLTARQRQVAGLLAAGLAYKEIARKTGISPSTVTNHVNHIYARLGVAGRMELAQLLRE